MTFEACFVLVVVILIIIALVLDLMRPGLVFFSGIVVLVSFGIINTNQALSGFSNKGMLTVAVLFLVSGGIKNSGALNIVAKILLPQKRGKYHNTILKILFPVASLSAFLNNTPVVVIFAPMVKDWAEKMNLSPQKFLIPLSYATILGGMCTLIGTSTNLVVHGLMLENGLSGLSMFEIGKVGFWIAIAGFAYISLLGYKLLPGAKNENQVSKIDYKKYFLDATLPINSNLINAEINNGRCQLLKGIRFHSIEKSGKVFYCRKEKLIIEANDKLVIKVKADQLAALLSNKSLELKAVESFKNNIVGDEMMQIEAVISPRFPGINQTIKEFDFISHYQAEVLAVYRNGETISSDVGSVKMKTGDSLVMLTNRNFIKNWGDSQIFYLTSFIGEIPPPRYKGQRGIAAFLILFMIIGTTIGQNIQTLDGVQLDMFLFASITAMLMAWVNIMPNRKYTKFITWDILITIACAFGISKAIQVSGAADTIATTAINFSKNWGPIGVLITIYLITNIFTEIITNSAAAALAVPIAISAASQLNVNPTPFLVAICIAASASFSTPIGYQTNLLVQGLGNYKFKDYTKIGFPLNIIAFIISILLIPIIWPF